MQSMTKPGSIHDSNEITVFTHATKPTVTTICTVSTKCALNDFVQTVAYRGIVETLESWRRSKKDPELSFQVRFRSPAGRLCLT